ncbi:MAG: hypothetical protein Q8L22_03870, partial [Reyranella sp.]|nr:hypothetical protein [Reyranella sp.]
MTAGPKQTRSGNRLRAIGALAAVLAVTAALFMLFGLAETPGNAATIGEKLAVLRSERASLQ